MRNYLAWTALPALILLLTLGCERNPEHRATLENLNNHPEIIQRGGVVKSVEMEEPRSGVHEFRGEILDTQGNVIGTVRGARVEGFGTRINRIRWEGEEEVRGGRGNWQGQRGEGVERLRQRLQPAQPTNPEEAPSGS